jgi:hypothetical protein
MMTLLVILAIGPVSAVFPGDEWDDDYDIGSYSEWAYALVGGEWGASYFNYGYFKAQRDAGSANTMGYLWYWIYIDEEDPIENYEDGDLWQGDGGVDAFVMQMISLSWFYESGHGSWPQSAETIEIGYQK